MKKIILSGILGLGLAACTSYLWNYNEKNEPVSNMPAVTQSSPDLSPNVRRLPRNPFFPPPLSPVERQRLKASAQHRQEYASLMDNINMALAARETDIQRLADELYQDHLCADDDKTPLTPAELQRSIGHKAEFVEGELGYRQPGFDKDGKIMFDAVLPTLREHLAGISEEVADKDKLSGRSFLYSLAMIRSYERCLSEPGVGDVYRDAFREKFVGNCEEARNLFSHLDDIREIVRSYRNCVAPEQYASATEEEIAQQFYGFLETASDGELSASAEFIPWDEFNRWNDLCIVHQRGNGENVNQAYAFCVADFTAANAGGEGGFNFPAQAKMSSDRLQEILSSIPDSDRERHCALEGALEEAFYRERIKTRPEGSFSDEAWITYQRCMGKSS